MLLPSAFDCAPHTHPSCSLYAPAPTLLSPPSASRPCPTSPVSSNIYSACRSLQSLITTNLPSTPSTISRQSRTQPQLASPIALMSGTSAHSRKQLRPQTPQCATKILQPQTPRTPPRASRKRRRSLCEDDDSPSRDQENILPSTPKRQRLCPPSIPLGLMPTDFDALQEAAANIPIPTTPSNHPPSTSSPSTETETEWTSANDSALVSLILHKLRLKQSDWDECALRLGKGKDSIGERWKLLIGEGEVGLRRGRGGRRRGGVEGMDFGGALEVMKR